MKKFPDNFLWRSATSSYQIEGAHDKDGKGPSIWDAFCTVPGRINNFENGNIALDHYHRFEEDIQLMKSEGLKAYRFSIAWSRVMPDGKGAVNEKGVEFYSKVIDKLLENDIEPWITLYHWDLPLALQMENDGWLNPKMPEYFRAYADLCFDRFGDRVKNWITHNEPWVVAILGHGHGVFAPGRKSNSEPYQVAHHLLLSHAEAVELYREKYSHQKGQIGITNNFDWREPLTDSEEDQAAAERARLFFVGWFADPIWLGDYPQVMKERLGERLPVFTPAQKQKLIGSADFFGLNHYTTQMVSHQEESVTRESDIAGNAGLAEDQSIRLSQLPEWPLTQMSWGVVPWGCRKLLEWLDKRYGHPPIYITENGFACDDKLENGEVNDQDRLSYYEGYLHACHEAIENGVDLRGYFAWSMFDNFEWASGYIPRFGLNYIDYETLERIPKASVKWLKEVIENNGLQTANE